MQVMAGVVPAYFVYPNAYAAVERVLNTAPLLSFYCAVGSCAFFIPAGVRV